MKKYLLISIAMAFMAVNAIAMPINEAAAREAARLFIEKQASSHQMKLVPSGGDMQLVYTEMSSVINNQPAYYIYNMQGGFLVVAGDDSVNGSVLVYGDAPLDLSDMPCGLQCLLDQYKQEIDNLFSHNHGEVMMSSPRVTAGAATSVEPLLTALWNQREPYNNDCPFYHGEKCLTGCCCTSLSQVMYYWKYSDITSALGRYTTRSLGITLPALDPTDFDWDNMLDEYGPGCYTEEQGAAVALLMRYVGQAEYMDYSPEGSGASENNIVNAVLKFGYDQGVECLEKKNYSASQWRALMLAELYAQRPIVYSANDKSAVGHSFNVDGYDAENGLYHINFGWGGNGNAYCALDDFTGEGYTFNNMQSMIIGIQPPGIVLPTLTVSTTALSFNTQVGKPVTKTISVKGKSLSGALTVELNDSKGAYSIDKTSISAAEAAEDAIVSVTFNPAMAGMSMASVTISGDGVEPQTISLTGVAIKPVITVNPDVLEFNTLVGEAATATFTVRGTNLIGALTLTLEDASGNFAIDKTSMTVNEASAGATVTVTCNSVVAGMSSASIIVAGEGAEPQTVGLTCVVEEPAPAEPSITTSVTSLDFGDCYNGYNEQRSLVITGVSLTHDISLSIEGPRSNDFTICAHPDITPELAAQGIEITVNSFPYTTGRYSRLYLVISCPDVPDVKIPITGYGIKTGAFIYPSESSMTFSTQVGQSVCKVLGVKVTEFSGWLASYGGTTDPDGLVNPPLTLLPIHYSIEGDDSFGVLSCAFARSEFGGDSVNIVVIYKPLTEGTHSAQLTLNTTSATNQAHPVVVELTGVAESLGYLPGDIDGDGELTENDINLLNDALTNEIADILANPVADVNRDGIVNLQDAINLVDKVLYPDDAQFFIDPIKPFVPDPHVR